MKRQVWWVSWLMVLGVGAGLGLADPPQRFVGVPLPQPGTPAADDLTKLLRDLMLRHMPDPLYTKQINWGHQSLVTNGITWRGPFRPVAQKAMRNDGLWQELVVTAVAPHQTLELQLRDLKAPEPTKLFFVLFGRMEVRVQHRRQRWESGVRLASTETRARARVSVGLACEVTARLEANRQAILPDAVLTLRALAAQLHYDRLVVEHTAGVGGDAARILGEALHNTLNTFRPQLEADLLKQGNAAILKALEHREVRISLGKLLSSRPRS
jgi:hypothetical protein